MRLFAALLCLASPVMAETPLDSAGFDTMVRGKTITYSNLGGPYGIEYYGENRSVIWSFIGGDCEVGTWFEEATPFGPSICFEYESTDELHCWYFYDVDGQLRADSRANPGGSMLYQMEQAEPLICDSFGT